MTRNPPMPDTDLPKIWYTKMLSTDAGLVSFKMSCAGGRDARIRYQMAHKGLRSVDADDVPEFLYYLLDRKINPARADVFLSADGLIVVSPRVRDILVQFDLGKTRLFEVPIYKSEQKEPTNYPPHYLLHVMEHKDTVLVDASENVRQLVVGGEDRPRPGAHWESYYNKDDLAVRASSAEGVDIWGDPNFHYRVFFSDRLKRAIDAAKIRTTALKFFGAKVRA